MLQIVIWGMAAMLVVKGMDILHQQSISRASGNEGSSQLSNAAAATAVIAAAALIYLAQLQTSSTGTSIPSLSDNSGNYGTSQQDADINAMMTADALDAPPAQTKEK